MKSSIILRLIAAVLAVALLLCACGKAEPPADVDTPPDSSAGSENPTDTTPPEPEPEPEPSPYGDLLSEMTDVGKTVTVYGDLKGEDYSEAISSLEKVLDGYSRTISVVAYSLDNRKALSYNTEAKIFSACAVKAPYSLYCCYEMEKGKATLDTKMKYEKKHYETGTGDMQYSPVGTTFDMRTIINKSMSISDNVGYMMQVDYFGREGYNKWISSLDIGAASLAIKPTVWSLYTKSRDLAVVWREMYKYFETQSEYSKFLYASCTNTAGNYATAALEGVEYSHKQGHNRTGDWKSYSDAGIVWKEGNPYIIVILTNAPGPSSYDAGIMADVIKIVHNQLF